MASNNEDRPRKRPKISPGGPLENVVASPGLVSLEDSNQPHRSGNDSPLASLTRSITPPPQSRSRLKSQSVLKADADANDASLYRKHENNHENGGPRLIPSPIQLTNIRDLPESSGNNVDTVKLRDILGDPMIRECWQFNYLFDVDFLMSQFDEDIRDLVQVKVVHGSWKKDAPNRIRIDVSRQTLFHFWRICTEGLLSRLILYSALGITIVFNYHSYICIYSLIYSCVYICLVPSLRTRFYSTGVRGLPTLLSEN